MGSSRTRRKNALKRRKRRAIAALHAEMLASEQRRWTPEAEELERMRDEEQRQRTHEQWSRAVERSAAEFERKKRLQEEREAVVRSIRQKLAQRDMGKDVEGTIGATPSSARTGAASASNRVVLSDTEAAMLLAKEAQARAYEAMRNVQNSQPISSTRGANQVPSSITRVACAFYSRTGACPFGRSGCARVHENARSSKFLILRHMFEPRKSSDRFAAKESEEGGEQKRLLALYEDVLAECQRFGPVARMEILQNTSSHLVGNVYIEFMSAEGAFNALQGLQLRWYAGKHVNAALVPMMGWEAALCGPFLDSRCARGNDACNYLHCHRIPDSIRPKANAQEITQPISIAHNTRNAVVNFFEPRPVPGERNTSNMEDKSPALTQRPGDEAAESRSPGRSGAQRSHTRDRSRYRGRRSSSRERGRPSRSPSWERSRRRRTPSRSRSPRRRSRSRDRSRSDHRRYKGC